MQYNSKFFIASLKRTAMNCVPLVRRMEKLDNDIKSMQDEKKLLQVQLDGYQAPIKEVTGGYTTMDLLERKVTGEGNQRNVQWVLKYPATIIPPKDKKYPGDAIDDALEGAPEESANEVDSVPFENPEVVEEKVVSPIAEELW